MANQRKPSDPTQDTPRTLLRDVPACYAGIYAKAMAGKSRRSAIRAFCLECCGWQREEVRYCTAPACPLYPYRPYKRAARSPVA